MAPKRATTAMCAKRVVICMCVGAGTSFGQPIPGPSFTGHSYESVKLSWQDVDAGNDFSRPKGAIEASMADEILARWNLGGCGNESCQSNRPGFHPGTRVIVEIPSLTSPSVSRSTKVNLKKYLAEFRNRGYWPFRACYETTARETGSRGGDTWVRVQGDARGRIAQTRVLNTNVVQRPIADCVSRAVRSLKLSVHLKRYSSFVLRIRLFPGDAPIMPSRLPANPKDVINSRSFGSEVDTLRRAIEDCVLLGIRRDSKLWGRLSMVMKVDKDGRIVDFTESDSHFPDGAVVECARTAARNTTLSKPSTAGNMHLELRVGEIEPTSVSSQTQSNTPPNE